MSRTLKEKNKELVKEINSYRDEQSLMTAFAKENILCYVAVLFFPPLGIYRILMKKNSISTPAKTVWIMFALFIAYEQLKWILSLL
ncbi:MAG: hypothetical protein EOM64_03325 [Erysipelotrichia bacterium]|nr:hypothetical protein [Erysipelotrichia bacterium]